MKRVWPTAWIVLVYLLATACGNDQSGAASEPEPSTAPTTVRETTTTGDLEAWCLSWNSGGIPGDDGMERVMQAALTRAQQESVVAPEEIADLMALHVVATERFVETMASVGFDEGALSEDDFETIAPTTEEAAAVDELDSYSSENCENHRPREDGPTSSDPSSGSDLSWTIEVDAVGTVTFTAAEPEGAVEISVNGVVVPGSAFNDWIEGTPAEIVYHLQVARDFEQGQLCSELQGARETATEEASRAANEAERIMWTSFAQHAQDTLELSECG